ncbi:hypothetical protein QFC22_003335 [Naganishia vaughanmartiniae]|uniref:Uncharacterized protein n=1 Tax=Naganishia vaughanmartiniae TaxID=1424756 RepID=A0ACC2X873_9TREE|nr:hypothetical protein QFC22_003335 [Naganishia vaughanmartiniae]
MGTQPISPRSQVKSPWLSVKPSALDAAGQRTGSEFRHRPPNSTTTLSPGVSTVGDSLGSLILATPATSCFQLAIKSARTLESLETPRAQSEIGDELDPFERSFSRFLLSSPPKHFKASTVHPTHRRAPKISSIPLPELDHTVVPPDDLLCECRNKRRPLKSNRSIVLPDFEDAEAPTPTESLMANTIDDQSDTSSISSGLQITVEEEALSASDDEMTTGYLRRVEKHVNLRSLWFNLANITSAKDER